MNWVWPKSKAVHTFDLNEVLQTVGKINLSQICGSVINKKNCVEELNDSVKLFRNWVADIVDLTDFEHCYAVNGVTDGINQWLFQEKRIVQRLLGDYHWPSIVSPETKILNNVSEVDCRNVLYVTNPSSEHGCYRDDWEEILEKSGPIVLDCAYVGSAFKKRIQINKKVETIFFSYSKSFGLGRLRLGWVFSRHEMGSLNQLHSLGYYPSTILPITNLLTEKFKIDDIYHQMRPKQERICAELNLSPSDSYLLANAPAINFPDWARENSQYARVPLANFYYQLQKSQVLET